jgi:hypothetical protein
MPDMTQRLDCNKGMLSKLIQVPKNRYSRDRGFQNVDIVTLILCWEHRNWRVKKKWADSQGTHLALCGNDDALIFYKIYSV